MTTSAGKLSPGLCPSRPDGYMFRPGGELAAGDLFGTLARRAQEGGPRPHSRFNLQQLAIEREVTRGVCAPSTGGAQQGRCEGAGSMGCDSGCEKKPDDCAAAVG